MPDPDADKPKSEPEPEARYAELNDRFLRLAAEFDNWKKRAGKELAGHIERAEDAIYLQLLPVLDNVERALEQVEGDDPVFKGMRMVYQQLLGLAQKLGIQRIDPIGEPFDAKLHHAIQELETVEMPSGTVATVHVPGYRRGARLLRPAMVTVAKGPRLPPAESST